VKTKKTWCDECKIMVYDCDHLRGRDASLEVPKDLPRDPGKRALVFLAFNQIIPAAATAIINVDTQVVVKPRRIVVDPTIADGFMLMDVRIGHFSFFAACSGGGASCAVFPPTPPKYEPIANLAGLPKILLGQKMSLVVRNRDFATKEFNALVWCDTFADE
jgi:hypothetical protein